MSGADSKVSVSVMGLVQFVYLFTVVVVPVVGAFDHVRVTRRAYRAPDEVSRGVCVMWLY
jgi:hypothetical protein